MSVPFIIAAGLAAAGTGATIAGNEQSKKAANDKVKEELLRQQGFQKRAGLQYADSLAQSTPQAARGQISEGEARANAAYQAAQSTANPVAATPQLAQPGAAGQNIVQDQRNALATTLSNARAARLAGFNEFDIQQAIKDLHANSLLGVIGRESAASSGVLPYELQGAEHKGDPLRAAGMGLSLAGSLAGLYGALAVPLAGASVAPAAVGTASTTSSSAAAAARVAASLGGLF